MATVTGFTAERMLEIENSTIVDGDVVGDDLILKRRDDATINAGSVRGPVGSPGVTTEELIAILMPVGLIADYIGVVAPTNWLMMIGQTIVDGETVHPDLWEVLPASMKSGSDIVMPDTRGRVSVGYNSADTSFDAIGETGGAKTHTLSTGEMPSHNHTGPSHSHVGTTGNDKTDHHHGYGGTTTTIAPHNHSTGGSGFIVDVGLQGHASGSEYAQGVQATTTLDNSHAHNYSGITDGVDTNHQHDFTTGLSGTGNTGLAGGAGPHNNLQPYITFLKIIKAA